MSLSGALSHLTVKGSQPPVPTGTVVASPVAVIQPAAAAPEKQQQEEPPPQKKRREESKSEETILADAKANKAAVAPHQLKQRKRRDTAGSAESVAAAAPPPATPLPPPAPAQTTWPRVPQRLVATVSPQQRQQQQQNQQPRGMTPDQQEAIRKQTTIVKACKELVAKRQAKLQEALSLLQTEQQKLDGLFRGASLGGISVSVSPLSVVISETVPRYALPPVPVEVIDDEPMAQPQQHDDPMQPVVVPPALTLLPAPKQLPQAPPPVASSPIVAVSKVSPQLLFQGAVTDSSAAPASSAATTETPLSSAKDGESNRSKQVMSRLFSRYATGHTKKICVLSFSKKEESLTATAGADGTVRFWSMSDTDEKSYPVDIAWAHKSLQCAVAIREATTQLTLLEIQFPKPSHVKMRFPDQKPHSKELTGVTFVPGTDDKKLVTVGNDCRTVIWDLQEKLTRTQILHTQHSTGILCLCPNLGGDLLFTGGGDKKIIQYDFGSAKTAVTIKLSDRVNRILTNEFFPNCLLASTMSHENQINLVDLRAGEVAVTLGFRIEEGKYPSVVYAPSWHPAGRLISLGTQGKSVNVWDLRYTSKTGDLMPSQTFTMHEKRVYRADFHPTHDTWMASISSDHKVGFHTFNLGVST